MQNINYVTVISPVKEVTLWGKADASTMQNFLKEEGVMPFVQDGKTEVLISGVDARYMGIRFQELSFSIHIGDNQYFLAHAFNSLTPFAFAERKFFQTPYYAGKLTIETTTLALNNGQSFYANQRKESQPLRQGAEDWQLKICLPKALRKKPNQPHYFYARLQGDTQIYQAHLDDFSMNGTEPIFEALRASHFQPIEWRIREKATHSKSATVHG